MVKITIMKLLTKSVYLIKTVVRRKLLLSKKRIPVSFQIDSGSTCSILPVNVYKDIRGDYDLTDLNTVVKPVLSLCDEET